VTYRVSCDDANALVLVLGKSDVEQRTEDGGHRTRGQVDKRTETKGQQQPECRGQKEGRTITEKKKKKKKKNKSIVAKLLRVKGLCRVRVVKINNQVKSPSIMMNFARCAGQAQVGPGQCIYTCMSM
jgi:hypothetical protein